jgi:hypothetical protein
MFELPSTFPVSCVYEEFIKTTTNVQRGSAEEGEIKRQGLEHEQDEQNRYGRASDWNVMFGLAACLTLLSLEIHFFIRLQHDPAVTNKFQLDRFATSSTYQCPKSHVGNYFRLKRARPRNRCIWVCKKRFDWEFTLSVSGS